MSEQHEELGPLDSASQVAMGTAGGVLVAPCTPASALAFDVATRKRLYAQMDRDAKYLSPEALALFTSSKGKHKKRERLLDLFISNGKNLGMVMNLYAQTEQESKEEAQEGSIPMTEIEIVAKYGQEMGDKIMKDCKDRGAYDTNPADPKDERGWTFHVYTGRTHTKTDAKIQRVGMEAGSFHQTFYHLLSQLCRVVIAPRCFCIAGRVVRRMTGQGKGGRDP